MNAAVQVVPCSEVKEVMAVTQITVEFLLLSHPVKVTTSSCPSDAVSCFSLSWICCVAPHTHGLLCTVALYFLNILTSFLLAFSSFRAALKFLQDSDWCWAHLWVAFCISHLVMRSLSSHWDA